MKITDYIKQKRQQRLEADLMEIQTKNAFDSRYALGISFDGRDNFTRQTEIYRIWSMGNSYLLRQLYNGASIYKDEMNFFWHRCPPQLRMLHSGIPGLISTKMATVLFSNGINSAAVVYNDKGETSKTETKKANELLDNLVSLMNVNSLLECGATTESWSGHICYKLSHDIGLSNYPILEAADIRRAEVIKERGITKAIIFKFWYTAGSKKFRLNEIYATNTVGDATISYKLYMLNGDKEVEVPLNAIRDTEHLLDNLDENQTFTYTGLKGLLAFEKPNKSPSLLFQDSIYGASDYEGAIDSFDALDEAYSAIIREIRANRTIRYLPESMIPYVNGERKLVDDFTDAYMLVAGDQDQNGDSNKIQVTQIPDKTEQHLEKWRTALTTAINRAGLSPFALGITGLEAVNSSSESQQERNKVTLETRKAKLSKWKPFIELMLTKILELNSWMQKNTAAKQDAFSKFELNWSNTKISVDFGDYINETTEKRATVWGTAKAMGIASVKEAVKNLHPDWTDEEVDAEVNIIHFENGMSLDNPMALPTLDGADGLKANENT